MLRLFLVEDEFVVREGIKNNINWSSEGFEFCGDASDGELAYPLILNERPDIIITDIRMPFMDGLELSRLVKKDLPQSKIIILSGHEEFSLAREAIKIGVTEYLLKPISAAELLKAVKHVGKQLIAERIEKENYERYKREVEDDGVEKRRRLFNEMVEGKISSAVILERGKALGIELGAQNYQIVLFKYNNAIGAETGTEELLMLSNELSETNSRYRNIIVFDRAIEGSALIIKGDTLEQLELTREGYLAQVRNAMARYPAVHYFGGIGKTVSRLKYLPESFETAARAFSHRFILARCDIINYEELSTLKEFENNASMQGVRELESMDIKKAEFFLRNGEAGEINFFVEEFFKGFAGAGEKSILLRQYFVLNIYITVINFIKEIGATQVLEEEPFKGQELMKDVVTDLRKAKDYVVRIFTAAIETRDVIRTKRYCKVIEQAKEFINNHYKDDKLSLNEVAAYVNISPSHFSAVFSREAGKSFIRYLTDLRIKKAKELLKCSDLRCQDISIAVGYKDPHYFSYLFKKSCNCSPVQYRAEKK